MAGKGAKRVIGIDIREGSLKTLSFPWTPFEHLADPAGLLHIMARHPVVSQRPSPLFWFTTSELLFSRPTTPGDAAKPLYLDQPELVFKRIWASPTDDRLLNVAD